MRAHGHGARRSPVVAALLLFGSIPLSAAHDSGSMDPANTEHGWTHCHCGDCAGVANLNDIVEAHPLLGTGSFSARTEADSTPSGRVWSA